MDGELTEATSTIKSSSCIWIIGSNQNPGNAISTYGPVRLRFGTVAESLNSLIDLL